VRGIVLAGVFATAMGSLSAALNALATSATNDWYIPYFARQRSEAHHVAAARVFTVIFSILMIAIACAFAWAKVSNPNVRIIPVVLGIAGFILGPMLGVFLLGMFTKRRGSDLGNIIAITLGLCATIYLGGLHNDLLDLIGLHQWTHRPIITVSFTWFALVGAVVVCVVGLFFRTPETIVQQARQRRTEADQGADVPIALRGEANDRAFEVVNKK
jgi:Na+/proline symporter